MGIMNYIRQINAFYNQIEINPLSSSASILWHTLMHINNKARWVEKFSVAVSVLRVKSGLTESTFKRAREELKKRGYIHFQSQGGNRAAMYQIVNLEMDYSLDGNQDLPPNQNMDHNKDQTTDALIKHKQDKNKKKTKENNNINSEAILFYIENIGEINPYMEKDLTQSVKDMGEALVIEAMKRALDFKKSNWGYIKGILQAWKRKGITSVEQALANDALFNSQRKTKQSYKPQTEEVIPDWFHERKGKKQLQCHEKKTIDHDIERAELRKLITEYS